MTDTSLSVVFYTANTAPIDFRIAILDNLEKAIGDLMLITVSKKPMEFGDVNLVEDTPSSHFNIYRQALTGAKSATTKYIALCEDDQLYSPAHFNYRPRRTPFAYNLGYWGIYTWQDPPMYNYKGRKNLGNLICDRVAFIEAMEERFAKYPNPNPNLKDIWAEPGKYERQLGVTIRESEDFYSQPPNVKFSHPTELSFNALGTRKRSGELRATDIPYWNRADDLRILYG